MQSPLDTEPEPPGSTAIILAAGTGSRLRGVVGARPKTLVDVGGESLLSRSLRSLRAAGVRRLVVVGGYRRALLRPALRELWPDAVLVENESYGDTGSMRSLALAVERLDAGVLSGQGATDRPGVLVLESDLLFERRALEELRRAGPADAVLVSGPTGAGDEVWVCGTDDGTVREISKDPSDAWPRRGELVGISLLTPKTLARMTETHRAAGDGARLEHYEERIAAVAVERDVRWHRVDDLGWAEVDTPEQLARARRHVLPAVEARDGDGATRRMLLLTPGPANTSERVRAALGRGDECPREAEFAAAVGRVREKLLRVLGAGDGWTAVPLAGSGTAAVEATLATLVPPDGRVLVLENGAYGRRAARVLEIHGISHRIHRTRWNEPVDSDAVRDRLADGDADGPFTHLFLVHHETTTGVLNPLEEVAAAGREHGLGVLVDAMSSFGGVPLEGVLSSLDAVVSSSNKCVQSAPGVSFVLVRSSVLAAARHPPRSLYLDLRIALEALDASGQFAFTPPVQVVWALEEALDELIEETVAGRRARYDACYEILRSHADRLGLRPVVDPDHHSRLLTAFHEPDGEWFDFAALHENLRRRNVTIYPGKLADRPSFRVAHMGAVAPEDVERGMRLLGRELDRLRTRGAAAGAVGSGA